MNKKVMKTYKKHLIKNNNNQNDLNEASLVKTVGIFKKVVKLLGDLIVLKKVDLDEYELQQRSKGILDELDNILRTKNIDPVYRDMIRCGVKTALENLNFRNRQSLGY